MEHDRSSIGIEIIVNDAGNADDNNADYADDNDNNILCYSEWNADIWYIPNGAHIPHI